MASSTCRAGAAGRLGPRGAGGTTRGAGPRRARRASEPGPRPVDHGDGRGPIHRNDRVRPDAHQLGVQRDDLRPVGVLPALGARRGRRRSPPAARKARRVPLVPRKRSTTSVRPSSIGGPIPPATVLVAEQHDPARRRSGQRSAPREQHQREQPTDLGLVGHQLVELAGEVDGAAAEVTAGVVTPAGVPRGEYQIHHREHAAQALGQLVVGRHPERDARRADLLLRTRQPRRHRRLRHEECLGDLRGRSGRTRAEGSAPRGHPVPARVSAQEDQAQPLVVHPGRLLRLIARPSCSISSRGSLRVSVCSRRRRSSALRCAVRVSQAPGLPVRPAAAKSAKRRRTPPRHTPRRCPDRRRRAPSRRPRGPTRDGAPPRSGGDDLIVARFDHDPPVGTIGRISRLPPPVIGIRLPISSASSRSLHSMT